MLQTRLSLLALCCLVLSALSLRVPTSLQFRSKTSLNSLVSPTSKKSTSKVGVVGEANLDWANIGFEYRQTNSFVQCTFKDGKWGEIETRVEPYINLHIGATSLHYGQACFEGMKAFQGADGKVRIFRPQENAKRMTASCNRICMEPPSEEMFIDAVKKAVRDNLSFLPPYGTGGALYIRPILFGSGPRIGLQPSDEYTFIVMVMPVADYYKGGIKPVHAVVIEDYDRAAPRGVGNAKVAGNYAADILASQNAKSRGFPIALYLDAKTNKYIEEFSTSNFLSIDKDGAYVTPKSETILPSVTNKSLMQVRLQDCICTRTICCVFFHLLSIYSCGKHVHLRMHTLSYESLPNALHLVLI